jgi:AAA15 family ATPase/GTPase
MFKKITLKNYRTHVDTTFELQEITLLMGSNNSGKSNLLMGIQHFSKLMSRMRTRSEKSQEVGKNHYYPHKCCLDTSHKPLIFACEWENQKGKVVYRLELYPFKEKIGCKEKIEMSTEHNSSLIHEHGYAKASHEMLLRTKLENNANLLEEDKRLLDNFFHSLAFVSYYNFQPAFLKEQATPLIVPQIDYQNVRIPRDLGMEGVHFQTLVKYVKNHEQETYSRFIAFLRRFVPSFHGILLKNDQVFWQFDMTKDTSQLPYFEPQFVSDGILKAGAVALLCALKNPPALIMIEEVENGVNIENVAEFLGWLRQTVGKDKKTQFILTTHSPSVIRQFSGDSRSIGDLDAVYNVNLDKKNYRSVLTNLNEALGIYVRMGTVAGDFEEKGGKEIVKVKPYKLTELFYDGILK